MRVSSTVLPRRLRLWLYLAALLPLIALWVLAQEGWNLTHPSEMLMAFVHPTRRLLVWLLPPLLLVAAVFGGRWFHLSSQARAEDAKQAAVQAEQAKQQNDEAAQAAALLAKKRETLEVLGLGLIVEKFRNAAVWEAINAVENDPHASILPKEPEVIGDLVRGSRAGKRSDDTYEYAARYFVEKVPLPGFVIFPKPTSNDPKYLDAGAGTLMGQRDPFALLITAGQIYASTPDEALGVIFDFFDTHPDVPAVYVYADDGYITRKFFRGYSPDDINGDPGWKPGDPTEAKTAFVLVRRDRVDKLIRPFAVDEPYKASRDRPANRLKTFYFAQEDAYMARTKEFGLTVAEWERVVPEFIEQIGQDQSMRSSLTPFWDKKDGFKPSPWIPVPWTQWQLKEFDDLPTLGYLHRPQYAKYVAPDGKPLPEKELVSAFSAAWQGALETLPEGKTPERMFFDAGGIQGKARGLVPMARGLSENHPDQHWLDTPRAIDLSARLDDTGAASPFVQIALAIIAGYRDGGVSATVNLRRDDGASILMVSPPTEPPEGRKPHPGAGRDPFKVPLMPENG